jgi:hypothetical protein
VTVEPGHQEAHQDLIGAVHKVHAEAVGTHGHHYRAQDIEGKQHLEHVIPQNKIITHTYTTGYCGTVLQMPLVPDR